MKTGILKRTMAKNRTLTLKQKLIGITVSASISIATVGSISLYETKKIITDYKLVVEHDQPMSKLLNEFLLKFRQIRLEMGTFALQENIQDQPYFYIDATNAALEESEKTLKNLENISNKEEKPAFDKLKLSWLDFKVFATQLLVLAKTEDGHMPDNVSRIIHERYSEKSKTVEDSVTDLSKILSADASKTADIADQESKLATELISYGSVLTILLLLILSSEISRKLARRLIVATSSVGTSSGSVGASVNQVSAASQDVMSAVEQQSAAIQQTSSALEEVSVMVARSAEKSSEIQKIAEQSKKHAQYGKDTVHRLIEAMNSLKNS